MDLESLNLSDRRNRFQVNRVDSLGQQQNQSPDSNQSATLVAYKSGANGESDATRAQAATPISHNGTVGYGNAYDTKYGKSFRHFTREALPRLDNYRNMMSVQAAFRPTLEELHDITVHQEKSTRRSIVGNLGGNAGFTKFGWIKGVFVRCLLNIWGVMLFLRLSWVVGQAGIIDACIIILLATCVTLLTGVSLSAISTNGNISSAQALLIIISTSVVTFITSLSLSGISTNGNVKAGGTYYMISRSLGPEFGASIGLIFAVANAIAVAMYTVGFAESMMDLLKSYGTTIVEDPTNNIRIVGVIAIIFQTGVVVIGMEWEATAQIGLLFILLAAMVDFVIGSFMGPLSPEEVSKGFVGFNGTIFLENLGSGYRYSEGTEQSFFSVFSIFFPAATGILAGANISGDLEDPQAAIPKGTLLAILVTTVSYIAFACIAGATVVRDAAGPLNYTDMSNFTYTQAWESIDACRNFNSTTRADDILCEWGLMNSFQVMELVSAWGLLIYLGCFAATISSALASFVSAPKVFQALCNDKLYPYLEFFGKGYGKNNEPVRGYVLTFLIALAFILIGELNAIAPLISNFFLAAYALINFSTFHASFAKPVGWRPTFKYYNMWLSLVGAVLCVAVMFLISWGTALVTFGVILFLYMIVTYRKPDVNWGSSTQAQTYKNALTSVQQLNNVDEHVKNYRPQILVLSGLPSSRPALVDFAYLITKHLSLMVCGHVVKTSLNNRTRSALKSKAQTWFTTKSTKAFYCVVDDMNFEEGAKALIQAYGVGKLTPNILLMGYKNDWMTCNKTELLHYFNVIHKAFDMNLAVAILRVDPPLDITKIITYGDDPISLATSANGKSKSLTNIPLSRNESDQSFSHISHASSGEVGPIENTKPSPKPCESQMNAAASSIIYKNIDGGEAPRDILEKIEMFQRKYKHGTIDVWWLYDDGGLTLLLPYIINTRSNWSTCKLRIFALANKKDELDAEQRSMAGLLSKFRIDYSDIKMISDITRKASDSTKALFEKQISDFRKDDLDADEKDQGIYITEHELLSMKDKTNRHMRLRELLWENSRGSSMIVMTLPMPKRGVVSAPLYFAWLELLTNGMPPFLLIRGNQTSVLTFYS